MPTPCRSALGDLPPYALADQDIPGAARVIQLGQNELGVGPSPRAIEAVRASVRGLNRYPEIQHTGLREAIAGAHGLDPARVLCGAGSMELLGLLATCYVETGTDVVVSRFGYKFFQQQCAIAGAAITVVPEPGMAVDVDALSAAVTGRTRMVFVVNPGNPTGARLRAGAVQRLRARLPERVLLVLDCAYAEFVTDPGFETGFGLVDAGENLVVLRTFSKAYGLAALRVGWLYGPIDVVETVTKARAPNSITRAGLAAAEAAIGDTAHVNEAVAGVVALREVFREQASSLGLSALPSDTNFVLIGCPSDGPLRADALVGGLKRAGIIVRPMHAYGLDDHVRVTIGSAAEMEILGDALARLA